MKLVGSESIMTLKNQRIRFRTIIFGIPMILGMAFATGCAKPSLVGRVIDDRNNAVQQAQIDTHPPTDYIITNQNGFFIIDRHLDENNQIKPLRLTNYKIRIRKVGYEDRVIPVRLEKRGQKNLGVIMMKQKKISSGSITDDLEATQAGPEIHELGQPYYGD